MYKRMQNELKSHDLHCYFLRCLIAKGPLYNSPPKETEGPYNAPPKETEGPYNATLQASGCS